MLLVFVCVTQEYRIYKIRLLCTRGVYHSSNRMLDASVKEDGEISDDDEKKTTDKKVLNIEVRKRPLNHKHGRFPGDDKRPVSTLSTLPKTQKLLDCRKSCGNVSVGERSTHIPSLMELPVAPAKKTQPLLHIPPDPVLPLTHFGPYSSSETPARLKPHTLCHNNNSNSDQWWYHPLYKSLGSDSEFQELLNSYSQMQHSLRGLTYERNAASVITCKQSDDSDVEIISVEYPDEADGTEVVDSIETPEDQDLDVLQLRRDALNSAFKSNKSCTVSSNVAKSANMLNSEGPAEQCRREIHQKLFNAESSIAAVACTSSRISEVELNHNGSAHGDVSRDNYDAVEMDLDSGSDLETSPPSFECRIQDMEWTSNTGARECSSINEENIRISELLESPLPPVQKTDKIPICENHSSVFDSPAATNAIEMIMYNAHEWPCDVNATIQSSVSCTTADNNEDIEYKDQTDDNISCQGPIARSGYCTAGSDADEKSTLLLREAVLHSFNSSKRQQQQSQLGACTLHDPVNTCKLEITGSRAKTSTVVPTSDNQLPVHRPVVISLTGESSDSDDTEQFEAAASSRDHCTTTTASSSLIGMSSNVDRVLHEIRLATEERKSQVCATVPVCPVETKSFVKYQYKPSLKVRLTSHMIPGSIANTMPKVSCSIDAKKLQIKEEKDNIAASSLEREISCEKRKVHQQKIMLRKNQLKISRKQEQINAAERRIRKMKEQLAAAEKIATSAKKQADNLRSEMIVLSRGIEHRHNKIHRLEARLQMALKNYKISANENISELKNPFPSGTSSAFPLLHEEKVNHKCAVDSKIILPGNCKYSVHSLAVKASQSSIVSSHSCGSSVALYTVRSPLLQNCSSTLLTDKGKVSPELVKLRHLVVGAVDSEADPALLRDKLLTSKDKCDALKPIQVAELSGDTDKEPVAGRASAFAVTTARKPNVHVLKPDMQTLQKSDITLAVSDEIGGNGITSVRSYDFVLPSDEQIKQILCEYTNAVDSTSSADSDASYPGLLVSDPVLSFRFPDNSALLETSSLLAPDSQLHAFTVGHGLYRPYHSNLMRFRSYGLSTCCWQKEEVISFSPTYSHKIDSSIALCQFDLMGRCLDDGCPWQHQSDYILSDREHLVDIVSFYPSVAGISKSTPASSCERILNEYVDRFEKDACARLPYVEQCLHLIEHVRIAAGLCGLHAVCTSARCWKLCMNKHRVIASDENDALFSLPDFLYKYDTVIPESADDGRYWMVPAPDNIRNIEEQLACTPDNEGLWNKLAHAKMMEVQWSLHGECVGIGLNVLARAVEANPSNHKLWRDYLDLYMNRSGANNDAAILYEQAVQYAPSYEFFWKYLQLPISYSQKMNICKRLRQYLCSPRCRDDAALQSHHLLETVLYQAHLCTMAGHVTDALLVIQAIVQSKPSVIWLKLIDCDRIVMWLAFLHLYECQELPKILYDPANSNAGAIVRKKPFVIPFQLGKITRISYETLLELFQSAFCACEKGACDMSDEYWQWIAALYRSRILMELSCCGWQAAQELCRQVIQQQPHLVSVWVLYVQLIIASDDCRSTQCTVIQNVVEEALTSNPHCVTLYLAAVSALIECQEINDALNFAERCPISLFDVDQLESTCVDPNLLYCCLLGQTVPPDFKCPALHGSVTSQYVTEQQVSLWLCYCLLLDLQGAHDQATEAYYLALSCLTDVNDIQRMWLMFFRRCVTFISGQLLWLRPAVNCDRRELWKQFESDVDRALSTLPVRRNLPFASETWDDYSGHNDIILLHITSRHDLEPLCESYLRRMPGNVELALRIVHCLLERRCVQLCRGLCLVALHSSPRALSLWNTCFRLNRTTADIGFMRSLYARAATMLPLYASVWKLRIMFELINKSQQHVLEVLNQCHCLQVNVASFLHDLLK